MIERVDVWQRLGEPAEQVGSANDPRTQDEHGVRWNEKWIYRARESQRAEQVVLWHRYEFRGVFRALPDGSWEAVPFESSRPATRASPSGPGGDEGQNA